MIVRPGQTWRVDEQTSFYVDEVDDEKAVGTLIGGLREGAFSAAALPLSDFASFELLEEDDG